VPQRKKPSVGTGFYVFCPYSEQKGGHALFAIQVHRKESTGNLWCKCVCGIRIHIDHGRLPGMTKAQAVKRGALLPLEF
jgi:hypothetical protein